MTETIPFNVELPDKYHVRWLAPRIKGKTGGPYTGEYGFAIELVDNGTLNVVWDYDGAQSYGVELHHVEFIYPKPTS